MKILSGLVLLVLAVAARAAAGIAIDVDAREVSRSLLHARLEIPATPGEFVLWYPKWVPGVHAPGGPVQNLAGLRFETTKGEAIAWRRDDEELARFHLTVPAGVDRVVARLDYICNQPTTNSSGIDSFGDTSLAVINWNTVLLYPETASIDEATAEVRLTLPAGWRFGTALRPTQIDGVAVDWKSGGVLPASKPFTVGFASDTLRRVVDSPLIAGEFLRTIELTGKNTPPGYLDIVSEAASAVAIDDKLIARYRALLAEAVALFGGAHFAEYHFLLVCSDQVPANGLEHAQSSFNAVGEREIIDEKKRKSWPAYLLPHEFVHSWCGKYRRPAGMTTTNFHTTERTKMLWVYEGLTQYLGEVLTVRSGLLSFDEYLPSFANKLDYLINRPGRAWRSLEDTAIASWQLRAHSPAWEPLRRGQDYYDEGLVIWMEADAIIREQSGGKRSFDDFCKKFFAVKPGETTAVIPYERDEIISTLKSLVDYDWDKFFHDRIDVPKDGLGLDFVEKLGYRIQFTPKQSDYLSDREKDRKSVAATASLGVIVKEDGKIGGVIPGLPADKAGLANGQTIVGVNAHKFSPQRLKDAIADSATQRKVDLLILDGDDLKNVKVDYGDGPKYLELARAADRQDILAAILKPLLPPDPKTDAPAPK